MAFDIHYLFQTPNQVGWTNPNNYAHIPNNNLLCSNGHNGWRPYLQNLGGFANQFDAIPLRMKQAALECGRYCPGIQMSDNTLAGHILKEKRWRIGALEASTWVNHNRMIINHVFDNVDAQEKTTLSFLMGQTFSALLFLAARGTGFNAAPGVFLHVDRFRNLAGNAVTRADGLVPDFIATIHGRVQIIEAKGSSNQIANGTLQHALDQVSTVTAVTVGGAGTPIDARIACGADIINGSEWRMRVVDPSEVLESSLPPGAMAASYLEDYRPWRVLIKWMVRLNKATTVNYTPTGTDFTLVPITDDTMIGMDTRILTLCNRFEKLISDTKAAAEFEERLETILLDYAETTDKGQAYVTPNGKMIVDYGHWPKMEDMD